MRKYLLTLVILILSFSIYARSLSIRDNPFQYDGEYKDCGSPLLYLTARYLNQDLGIAYFITHDYGEAREEKTLFDGDYNAFAANPIMNEDPSGHGVFSSRLVQNALAEDAEFGPIETAVLFFNKAEKENTINEGLETAARLIGREENALDVPGQVTAGLINNRGFNIVTRQHLNGGIYSDKGLDINGFDDEGKDFDGFFRNGFHYETGLDRDGFGRDGYNTDYFQRNGLHRNGTLYDEMGLNIDGYDQQGFHYKTGIDRRGFNRQKIHLNGTRFDVNRYDWNGYKGYRRRDMPGAKITELHIKILGNKSLKTLYDPQVLRLVQEFDNGGPINFWPLKI